MNHLNLLLILGLLSVGSHSARADEPCQPENNEIAYAKGIATSLQKFVPKVTKTGDFVIKEEYSREGTQVIFISFVDSGVTLFTQTAKASIDHTATYIKAGKTKNGDPGFSVALGQGNTGECRYNVLFRDSRFVVIDKGYKGYKPYPQR